MQAATVALWRVEYRTDASRADSLVIPVGFMLDAYWQDEARWLGLSYRERLTVSELDLVNLETWPELDDIEAFADSLFDRAWASGLELGSLVLAKSFPAYSALSFNAEPAELDLGTLERSESFSNLLNYLQGLEKDLQPAITAPVLPFETKSVCNSGATELRVKKAA